MQSNKRTNQSSRKTEKETPSPSPVKGTISTSVDIDPETGVSVRYAKTSGHKWYVLRATYGRELKARDFINSLSIPVYVPTQNAGKRKGKRIVQVEKPLIQQFVFVYATEKEVDTLVNHTPTINYITYYYNHFDTMPNGYNSPLTVKYNEMINFIRATSVDSPYIMSVTKEQVHLKTDDIVRVTAGEFKGVIGKMARVKGNLRVVLGIKGVGLIATAYIPRPLLEKIDPQSLD